jgi:hypothetical protein
MACKWHLVVFQVNKMANVIKHYSKFEVQAVVRFLHVEWVSQREIHRRLVSVYSQNISAKRKYLCGATSLKMAEGQWMMIQVNAEANQGPHILIEIVSLSKTINSH